MYIYIYIYIYIRIYIYIHKPFWFHCSSAFAPALSVGPMRNIVNIGLMGLDGMVDVDEWVKMIRLSR